MKRVLLATTALALLAGAQQAQAGDLYISVFGGANFLEDSSGVLITPGTTQSFASDADTGFVIGGVVGTNLNKWAKGLRVELEASYRRNDIKGVWTTSSGSTGGVMDGNMSNFAIMANLWYDIDVGSKVRPYVGGGVGWARARADAGYVTTFTDGGPTNSTFSTVMRENDGFAWQLGVGFNYEVAPDVDVGLGYRYFSGPTIDRFFNGKNVFRLDNDNHSLMVNLTVGIN